jgi:hypothetical protein
MAAPTNAAMAAHRATHDKHPQAAFGPLLDGRDLLGAVVAVAGHPAQSSTVARRAPHPSRVNGASRLSRIPRTLVLVNHSEQH